ncbi:MAG: hypothetical protein ACHP7N_07495 [Caulobacterales bacterium]
MSRAFRTGELVVVRSAAEILATLDGDGMLDHLPFMPEMARSCGQQLRVRRRAGKTCVEGYGIRRLRDTVFLDDARCDGAAHDGCQRNCLVFWKEAWLRRPDEAAPAADPLAERRARRALERAATRQGERFFCQSTQLASATTPLARWDLSHLLADVAFGDLTIPQLLSLLWRSLANRLRRPLGLGDLDVLAGENGRAPKGQLALRAGDWVKIRAAEDIRGTLGPDSKNRGLSFEPEMTRHVGEIHQVEFSVEKIILEETGKMARLTNTVALSGVVCQGLCAQNCPRANTLYWREAWLEPIAEQQAAE